MTVQSDTETPQCVICGSPIRRAAGEVAVFVDSDLELGEFEGSAYHLKKCEDEVFETVHAQDEGGN